MHWKEKLCERKLKRPIDEDLRAAIHCEFRRRRDQIPMPTEFSRNASNPELTLGSQWTSFIVHLTRDRTVVNAELSVAAKMFATEQNRRDTVSFIESVANDSNL